MLTREDRLHAQTEDDPFAAPPAPPPRIDAFESLVLVTGRQSYLATPWTVQASVGAPVLARQRELLRSVVTTFAVRERTVLELGVTAGFFALVALREGAASATCVGPDQAHVELIRQVGDHLGIERLKSVCLEVETWDSPADVVLALDLLDRLGVDSTHAPSLDHEIARLASLTRYLLIVEWLAPDRPVADSAGATNARAAESLDAALRRHFPRISYLGATTGHRALYAAYTTPYNVDGGNPLPLLEEKGTVIASRLQADVHSVAYWCRIYDDPAAGLVTKQATLDLAEREAEFLRRLRSDYFPKVVSSERGDGFSTVTMKRIVGELLEEAAPRIRKDLQTIARFALDCLNILEELNAAQIVHRDIYMKNILVRDDRPVLLDFAWSVWRGSPYETPRSDEIQYGDHDGVNVDTFMMGHVLKRVNDGTFPEMSELADLMSHDLPSLRLTDLGCIRSILELWLAEAPEHKPVDDHEGVDEETIVCAAGTQHVEQIRTLYELLSRSTQRSTVLARRVNELSIAVRERDDAIAQLDGLRGALATELGHRDAALSGATCELAKRDAALATLRDEVLRHEATVSALRDELRQRDQALERAGYELRRRETACGELEADVQRLRRRLAALERPQAETDT